MGIWDDLDVSGAQVGGASTASRSSRDNGVESDHLEQEESGSESESEHEQEQTRNDAVADKVGVR